MTWWLLAISTVAGLAALLHCQLFGGYGLLQSTLPHSLHFRPTSLLGVSDQQVVLDAATRKDVADWNIMYHQGGNSPWIPKVRGVQDGDIDTPPGCRIDQVHMMARHAERYPTTLAGISMLELYQHIQHANVTLQGDLTFANTWDFFMADPSKNFENLVPTGPFAGTLEAFATGVTLRTRYQHLLEQAITSNMSSLWASDSRRVIETAKYFAAGFFGIEWKDVATLHIIPEMAEMGGDTLTPSKTCLDYRANVNDKGREYGARKLYEWRSKYLPPIIERLAAQNPDIRFTEAEIYSMQELCGFETIAKGSSQWCNVFSHEEWHDFEYARDLLHYYRTGPGNPYSRAMGWLWLNATTNLLLEGPTAGPLFFSFVHDGDIIPMLSALELIPQTINLPSDAVLSNRTWRTSDVVPMGARIVFERLACPTQKCWNNAPLYPNHVYCDHPHDEYYVRINVNDAIVPIPDCQDGPGQSCPLGSFVDRVQRLGREAGDFREVCGLSEDAASSITFLHQ